MRRHQLSFGIENFSKDGNYRVRGYIDSNDPIKVLHDMLAECNKIYAPDKSFEDFCKSVETVEYDGIGRCDVSVGPM